MLGIQDMNIAHEIAKNIKADCIDDLIDLVLILFFVSFSWLSHKLD